ncbi:retrotransposon protein, putative, ty3-gypsy subclass, partial [Tanacetum coccineum]
VLPDSYLDVPNKDYGVIPRPQYRFTDSQQNTRLRPRARYDKRRETIQTIRREPVQGQGHCPLCVGDNIRSANLFPLEMSNFDIILEEALCEILEVRFLVGASGVLRPRLEAFGACGLLSEICGRFSLLSLPLTKLIQKGDKFVWNEEREKSFEELKRRLVSSSYLLFLLEHADIKFMLMRRTKVLVVFLCNMYHPSKANVVTNALSRKNFGIMACLKIQPEIVKDLELMEVELVVHGSEGYIASLKIEPNLILRIKEAHKKMIGYSVSKLAEIFQQEIIRLHDTLSSIMFDRDLRFTVHFWKAL